MEARKVLIVGDSLFAETLARTLANADVEVVASAPTPEAALPLLKAKGPDAIIVANTSEAPSAAFGHLLAACPDFPIIYADLSTNNIQAITSHRVGPRTSDLLAAIAALPKRG